MSKNPFYNDNDVPISNKDDDEILKLFGPKQMFQQQPQQQQQHDDHLLLWKFSDGSSNTFYVRRQQENSNNHYVLIYDPISPIFSSSGSYSGGKPFQKELSAKEFKELDDAFEMMKNSTQYHCPHREMGTGVFTKGSTTFIMSMGSFSSFEQLIRKYNVDTPHHISM
ncbi:hypothetical protein C9374_010167 [Naegleria lovaniensis]|uniref:Uncharacterized protein n=1 Tax=Naegleria lovaniensis TaxID=51637 RepID=A0AA88GHU1_NAELO|nr:uncharacterized protein C9374_010167 [Naegleria lovaniensis]KAG2375163.1 hypothetical protein C9374_010167 [Naegleria lovaniensis]